MKRFRRLILLGILLLSSCRTQTVATTLTTSPVTQVVVATERPVLLTETPAASAFVATLPDRTGDPTIFGSLRTDEIQAYALESVANAIFDKTMDGFIADGRIQEYQVTSVTVFPGSNGLLSEIIFNVRTTDPDWIAEGGTPSNDDWLNGKCYRFDFFTTETEYQLKNQRLCG